LQDKEAAEPAAASGVSWLHYFKFARKPPSGDSAIVHGLGEGGRSLESSSVGGAHTIDECGGVAGHVAIEKTRSSRTSICCGIHVDRFATPIGSAETPACRVTADGIPLTGTIRASPDAHSFQFKPDIQFRKGSVVAMLLSATAEDNTGQWLNPFDSSFTVVKDASMTGATPVSLFASANAVDVRFDAQPNLSSLAPYIRIGFERVPSH
jgi:hypothetical protein